MSRTKKDIVVILSCLIAPCLLAGIVFLSLRIYSNIKIEKLYEAHLESMSSQLPDPELDYPGVQKLLGVIIANLRDEPAYEGQRLGVSDFSVGNAIFVYEYFPSGFRKTRYSYPLFIEGTFVASAEQVGAPHAFSNTRAFAPYLNDYISQEIAIVYDEDSCYVYDGEAFHLLFPLAQIVSNNGSIEDAEDLSTHAEKLVLSELTPVASFE